MTVAMLGFGTLLKLLQTGTYNVIGEQTKVTPYAAKADTIDATNEQSPGGWKEFIGGLIDAGTGELEINLVPGGAAEATLVSVLGTAQSWRVVFPNGAYVGFTAILSDYAPATPIDGKITASVKYKISGQPTIVTASAPTDGTLPAIAGAATLGTTLTAYHGDWNNEPTAFTYQWNRTGTPISGATGKTYTLVSADQTHPITVTVTASNSAGSASATSAPTPNVA